MFFNQNLLIEIYSQCNSLNYIDLTGISSGIDEKKIYVWTILRLHYHSRFITYHIWEIQKMLKKVGELKHFYWFNQGSGRPVSQKCKATLLTTKITKNTRHVWLSYMITRYDKDGEIINYTGYGLTLLYIEKINNEWVVVFQED